MYNKYLTRHNIIFSIAISLMIAFGWAIGDIDFFDESPYFMFLFILILVSIFFYIPLFYLYLKRTKKRENVKNLCKTFRIGNWVAIILSLLVFLFGVYLTFYFHLLWIIEYEKIGLWPAIKLHFHWWYWFGDLGLIYDLNNLLYYLPFLIVPALLFWVNRLNKKIE